MSKGILTTKSVRHRCLLLDVDYVYYGLKYCMNRENKKNNITGKKKY